MAIDWIWLGKLTLKGLIGAAVLGYSLATLPVTFLAALGFRVAGVAAYSLAAFVQSLIGNVSAGSLFALLQSIGVLGISANITTGLGIIGSLIGGFLGILFL